MSPQNAPTPEPDVPAEDPSRDNSSLLLEIAWEVCQKVGGIYTVLRSKAPVACEQWGENYCTVGVYDPRTSPLEFEPEECEGPFGRAVEALRREGFQAHYGRWLITGTPRTILLDPSSARPMLAQVKYMLWEHHDISAPQADELLDAVLSFGFLVERLLHNLCEDDSGRTLLAHFHEWMAASAVPEIRHARLPVRILFTTHATLLGRYLAGGDPWFYDHLPFVDWQADARRYNIETSVRIERSAAHGAHLLTTVSDVTAGECRHLLGRAADDLLPNGLNIQRFVAMHEFQNLHLEFKRGINQFVRAMFFPSYSFDLDRTLYFFTSGRFEYRNKGFDVTLEALARLNARMRAEGTDRTVVFFLVTRRAFRSINPEVLRRRAMLEELKRNCDRLTEQFGQRLLETVSDGVVPEYEKLVDDYWRLRLLRLMHEWHVASLPTIVTHDLVDDAGDEVLQQLRYLDLVNRAEDPVKVVYHPDFIAPSSPLFGMDYDDFVRGCHLGIFPSFYEPWGYTPLECVARGVPAVTSDLSGFGTYVRECVESPEQRGVYVLGRNHRSFDDAAAELAELLLGFCRMDRRERIDLRNRVESHAAQFDWSRMWENYARVYRRLEQMHPAG